MSSLSVEVNTDRSSVIPQKIPVPKTKKKKDRVKGATTLQNIFHQRNQPCSLYYLSQAKSVDPNKIRNVLEESTPFKYPEDLEQFSFKVIQKVWKDKLRRKEIRTKYCDKTNVRTRQTTDLLPRLYVEEPAEVSGIKTLLDIDPEFYTIAEARPIDKRFSMSKYLEDIRDVLRTKLMAGYRFDEVLIIEEKLLEEQRIINEVRSKYKTYVDSFETFLSKDYDDSMKELRRAETASMKTLEKSECIRKMYTQLASIEFTVHKLEERWRDLKMYQKFLYYVSPVAWRKKFDYVHKRDLEEDIRAEPSTVFKKYKLTSQGQIPSLENLVDEYLDAIKFEEEPKLFFKTSRELKKVFRYIEIQNLNCLLHTEDMAIPMENMMDTMDLARKKFESQAASIQEMIDGISGSITWEEECAQSLKKKAMKLIDGQFKKLISDEEILRLHVYVEDVYETCIAANDSNMTIYDMMKVIEQTYNQLVLDLDHMPQSIVKKSEKHRFAEETRLTKLCKDARDKMTMVERITWRLKKSLEAPCYRTSRPLMFRSAPPEKPPKPPTPPRQPTAFEDEYLVYFTDYCKFSDNLEDYGIDLSVRETDLRKYSVMKAFEGDNA